MSRLFLALVAVACLLVPSVSARAAAVDDWTRAVDAFDLASGAIERGDANGKELSQAAAQRFSSVAERATTDRQRAVAFYNAGAAHQLAGDTAQAVLALRRGELLHPALQGLAKRLTAVRAAVRGDSVQIPTSDVPIGVRLVAVVWSVSPALLWWATIGAWCLFWLLLGTQLALARLRFGWLTVSLAAIFAATGGWAIAHDRRRADAGSHAVVFTEMTPRDQPDELIGQLTGGALRPGTELRVLESRLGSDGRPWVKVSPPGSLDDAVATQVWVPEAAIARITPLPWPVP